MRAPVPASKSGGLIGHWYPVSSMTAFDAVNPNSLLPVLILKSQTPGRCGWQLVTIDDDLKF